MPLKKRPGRSISTPVGLSSRCSTKPGAGTGKRAAPVRQLPNPRRWVAQFWTAVILFALLPVFLVFMAKALAAVFEPVLIIAGLVFIVRLTVWAGRRRFYGRDEW